MKRIFKQVWRAAFPTPEQKLIDFENELAMHESRSKLGDPKYDPFAHSRLNRQRDLLSARIRAKAEANARKMKKQ